MRDKLHWQNAVTSQIKPIKLNAVDPTMCIPAGQTQVKNFPVLDLGIKPDVPLDIWSLRVFGLVGLLYEIDWQAFLNFPQISDTSDFHCLTRWGHLDIDCQDVRLKELLAKDKPLENALFATLIWL